MAIDASITGTPLGAITGSVTNADDGTINGTIGFVATGTISSSMGVPGPAGSPGATGPQGPIGPEGPPGEGGTWGSIVGTLSDQTDLQTALNLKAPLASPALTGVPTTPTAATLTSTTQIASTAFVQQELAAGTAVAKNLEVYVRNQTGSTLAAGAIVYINGATGNRPTVTLAQANNDANSAQTFGFVKASIANNGFGYVIVRGELENVDTSALTEGVQLYLSPTTPGAWTTTKPSAPQHLVYVGIVVRAHPTQGVILVAVQNGYELNELHDVAISSPTNGQVLKYDSSTGLWYNGTDSSGVAWGGITGTLSSQTDLQTALDGKYSTSNPAGYITASALTGYATESFVTSQGYITSSALSPYLLSSTAASTYYPLTNPSGYITSSALAGYATESWVTGQLGSYLTTSTAASTYAPIASPTFTGLSTFNNPGNYAITVDNSPGNYTSISSGVYSIFNSTTEVIRLSASGIKYPDGVTQSVAYPGPSGFLLKADNLSGLASASTARTNLGLGTMATATAADYSTTTVANGLYYPLASNPAGYLTSAPVTSVAGKTGAVTLVVGDVSGAAPLASPSLTGTPTAPTAAAATNTTQVATTAFVQQEVPAASTTAAGKVELATNSEAHAQTSSAVANTPSTIPFALCSGMLSHLDFMSATAVSGSGAVTYLPGFREMYLSSTAVGRSAFFLGGQSGTTYTVFGSNANEIRLNFSKKLWVSGRAAIGINASYAGDSTNVALVTLGGYTTLTTGNMTSRGIGWRKAGGTSSVVELIVHNGTTFTAVSTTKTLATREQFEYMIYSDGTGNVTLYIDGAQAATTSAGPTGSTADFGGIYREQVEQNSTATTRLSMHCYGGTLYSER